MTILFSGALNTEFSATNLADSPAGNQVQLEVLSLLIEIFPAHSVKCISLRPVQSWPSRELILRSAEDGNFFFPGFINLPVLKILICSWSLFIYALRLKPCLIVSYNVTLSGILALRLLKIVNERTKVALILQDVNYPQRGIRALQGYCEYWAVRFASGLDVVFPITKSIIDDFHLPIDKAFVFSGGISRQTRELIASQSDYILERSAQETAVFAGALEPYNGIDCLIDYWLSKDIPLKLLVFGKGSLSGLVDAAAKRSPNIVYCGYVGEQEVTAAQGSAVVNFCLRYSRGINENYFFPSKFYNVSAANGYVICNKFANFPSGIINLYGILEDDFSNLTELVNIAMNADRALYQRQRLEWLEQKCQWMSVVMKIKSFLNIM